jgi:hypothetical protein
VSKEESWPITLRVEIQPEGLKQIVEEGRLVEFVDAFSTLAAEHIQVQVVDQVLAGAASEGLVFVVGFDPEDPYGTGPKPWPWGRLIRFGVRQELERMGRM